MAYEKTFTGVGFFNGTEVDPNWFERVVNLENDKVNKDMLDWGTMPVEITDKKTFYSEASKVFDTANHSIYMFGTPEEMQRVWDIWGKPDGLKATHVYIAINAISTQSNRHAFIMWVFASNYGNPYFRIISGYNGSYTGTDDKGWVNVNKLVTGGATSTEVLKGNYKVLATDSQGDQIGLDYSVLPQPNTFPLRQSDGTVSVGTPVEDNDAATKKYVDSHKTDVHDIAAMVKPGPVQEDPLKPLESTVVADIAEVPNAQGQDQLEIHIDPHFLARLDVEVELPTKIGLGGNIVHKVTLDPNEVHGTADRPGLKGLRVFFDIPYNNGDGQIIVNKCQDIRFPKLGSSNATIFVGNAIPDPQQSGWFAEIVVPQYNMVTNTVNLIASGGSVDKRIRITDVKGIL